MRDAGLTKEEIRELSRELGLPTADAPAQPCLSSRIPHGTPVTIDRLLGLVKLGMTQSAVKAVPAPASSRPRKGAAPAATAAVMYSN